MSDSLDNLLRSANAPSALEAFQAQLSRYLLWSKREQGPLIEDRARRVRFELFKRFRAIAKTPSGLLDELVTLGYAFKRRLDPVTGKAVAPEVEVAKRTQSLRYLSVSWIFAQWRGRRGGQSARYVATSRYQQRIGEAIVNTASGTESPGVTMASLLEGVAVQNEERAIVDAALAAQTDDMGVYIARKHQEWLQSAFGNRTWAVSVPGLRV